MFKFDVSEDEITRERSNATYQSYQITGNENPIKSARDQIASTSQNDISSGILTLYSLLITQKDICLKIIDDKTIKRLVAIIGDNDIDFQIKNKTFEFIFELCKNEKKNKLTHLFWNEKLQEEIMKIISDDNPSVFLAAPIGILSLMANWTKAAYFKLVNDIGLMNLLLHKLTLPISIPDQYGVLNGLSSLLVLEPSNSDNKHLIEVVHSVFHHISESDLNDQVLGKAFKVIGAALGAANDKSLEDLDLSPICQSAVQILQKQKRKDIQIEIVEFMCNAVYGSNKFASILLELGILDIFHKLFSFAPEKLMIQILITISNCILSTQETADHLSKSEFLKDSVEYLHYGTEKVKIEAFKLFDNIMYAENDFYNASFAFGVLSNFDILEPLSEFLYLDENDSESMTLIWKCLSIFYSAIDLFSKNGSEMPSPPIKIMMEESNYERLQFLAEFVDESIRNLADIIQKEVSKFIE